MLISIAPAIGNDPLRALSARQTLQWMTIFIPHHSLIARIPVELETLLIAQFLRDDHTDAKPMSRPARSKGSSDFGRFKVMADGYPERGTLQIGNRVDRKLDMVWIGADSFKVFPVDDRINSSAMST